jgi:hypothetical protein
MHPIPRKSFKEDIATFFEAPSREGLRELLKHNVGEMEDLDFKESWPDFSDVARHVLGMGNSGGGCIVVGVKDEDDGTLNPVGMSVLTDKADVSKGIGKYIPDDLRSVVDVMNFTYEGAEYPKIVGKKFQILIVSPDLAKTPFVSISEGKKIKPNQIYIRRGAATEIANHDELQRLINSRIESNYSTSSEIDLKQHLAELQILYGEIPRSITSLFPGLRSGQSNVRALSSIFATESNPRYPTEDYYAFVLRMIEAKKKRIERELGLAK